MAAAVFASACTGGDLSSDAVSSVPPAPAPGWTQPSEAVIPDAGSPDAGSIERVVDAAVLELAESKFAAAFEATRAHRFRDRDDAYNFKIREQAHEKYPGKTAKEIKAVVSAAPQGGFPPGQPPDTGQPSVE